MQTTRLSLSVVSCCTALCLLVGCTTGSTLPESGQSVVTLAPTSPFGPETIDGVLVTVGDQLILLSDLQNAIFSVSGGKTRLLPSGRLIGGQMTAKQAHQLLGQMIDQKVLLIKANELGFSVSEDELTERIQDFLKQQNLGMDQLAAQLKQSGKSMQDYRSEFKNEILRQMLIGRVIAPLVTVTDDEVRSFYLQQTGRMQQVSGVKLRSLMVSIPDNFTGNPADFPVVKTVEQKLAAKENFVDLVKQYSMSADAGQTGGLISPRPLQELPAPLREKLANLQVGDVVGPIVLGSSVFFFQYLGTEFAAGSDLQKDFATWKNRLQEIKFNERLGEYLKTERARIKPNMRPFVIVAG